MKYLKVVLISLLLVGCTQPKEKNEKASAVEPEKEIAKPDKFFQYSIWWAFVNKVFDGDFKVSELKKQGDVGLGSFDFMDGEMVMLDGVVYRIRENGEISVGEDNDEVVYANAAFFDKDGEFKSDDDVDYDALKVKLDSMMKNENYFYVYKAHGVFKHIKLGGVPKVEKPFTEGLDILLPKRPVFEGKNVTGTLVGFYCPRFIGNINTFGYHFHFISDDHKYGGHAMEFQADGPISVEFDEMYSYQFELPANETYENMKLESEFQYNK